MNLILLCAAVFLHGSLSQVRAQAPSSSANSSAEINARSEQIDVQRGAAIASAPSQQAASGYQPLTGKERWNLYLHDAYWSPSVFFRAAGPALGAQLNNDPAAWGQGTEGYSKRFANRFGRFALQETYEAAAAALLQHEVRYVKSKRAGFLPRAANALGANFVTYDRSGNRTAHIARMGSVFAAAFTGNLWMPDGSRSTSTAMRGAGMELGVSSAFNLVKEFAPELKRLFKWR